MSGEPIAVQIRILDKDYMVSCPPEQKEGLLECAALLDRRMREVRESSKGLGSERLAVVTALNLVHEAKQQERLVENRLRAVTLDAGRLSEKIEGVIDRARVVDGPGDEG